MYQQSLWQMGRICVLANLEYLSNLFHKGPAEHPDMNRLWRDC